jgi:polyisoprenoid-binding protein YceI
MKPHWLAFVLAAACIVAQGAETPIVVDKDHSEIDFDVKATLHSFSGKLKDYEAVLAADQGKITRGHFQFHFADLKTGDEKRDRDMLAWAENAQFPEVSFDLVSLKSEGDSNFVATGKLMLHGVEKQIQFPVGIVAKDNRLYSVDGDADLDTREFNLPIIRKFGMLKVNPVVKVHFHLQASAAAQ